MTVLGYLVPAAAVLALAWGAIRLAWIPARSPALAAVAVVAVFALIAVTPLCGFMFDCGCDWPWRGLHRHCNAFAAHAELKCPWCDDLVAGTFSMLIVFGASGVASFRAGAKGTNASARFGFGVLAGIVTFHVASVATATLAALATGYPLPFTS
jgi:hypothetical protein